MKNLLIIIFLIYCNKNIGQSYSDLIQLEKEWRQDKMANSERPDKVDGDIEIIRKIDKLDSFKLEIFLPNNWDKQENWPAIILFHGGGWHRGDRKNMSPYAKYYSSYGMLAIIVDYAKSDEKLGKYFHPKVCVHDGRKVCKYIVSKYDELRIDTNNIVLSGNSSGGHIASAIAMCPDENNTVFPAKSLILFSAVLDLPFDFRKKDCLELDSSKIAELNLLNPLNYVNSNAPPTIMFSGSIDPDGIGCRRLSGKMKENGIPCELYLAENERHGFQIFEPWFSLSMHTSLNFLVSNNIINPLVSYNYVNNKKFEKFNAKTWIDDYECWLDIWTKLK